jgi:hypothetical protein
MEWWGELWLNEGFATYLENLGATAARPNYAFLTTFYGDVTRRALSSDAKNESNHALATISGLCSGLSGVTTISLPCNHLKLKQCVAFGSSVSVTEADALTNKCRVADSPV